MNHAITRDRVDGKEREFHSLTCHACKIEEEASEIAMRVSRVLFPLEPFRFKFRIEAEVKAYLEEKWKTEKG